jgi:hypothetical protein
MKAEVKLTGGCRGHDSGYRCYCDSADVHIEFSCPNSQTVFYKDGKWIKNKKRCKQPNLNVSELSDQYSLARWLSEYYVPTEG